MMNFKTVRFMILSTKDGDSPDTKIANFVEVLSRNDADINELQLGIAELKGYFKHEENQNYKYINVSNRIVSIRGKKFNLQVWPDCFRWCTGTFFLPDNEGNWDSEENTLMLDKYKPLMVQGIEDDLIDVCLIKDSVYAKLPAMYLYFSVGWENWGLVNFQKHYDSQEISTFYHEVCRNLPHTDTVLCKKFDENSLFLNECDKLAELELEKTRKDYNWTYSFLRRVLGGLRKY